MLCLINFIVKIIMIPQSAFNRIKIVDIMFRPSEISCPDMVVDLWFVSELPQNWKTTFNDNIATCALPAVSAV